MAYIVNYYLLNYLDEQNNFNDEQKTIGELFNFLSFFIYHFMTLCIKCLLVFSIFRVFAMLWFTFISRYSFLAEVTKSINFLFIDINDRIWMVMTTYKLIIISFQFTWCLSADSLQQIVIEVQKNWIVQNKELILTNTYAGGKHKSIVHKRDTSFRCLSIVKPWLQQQPYSSILHTTVLYWPLTHTSIKSSFYSYQFNCNVILLIFDHLILTKRVNRLQSLHFTDFYFFDGL